MIERLLESDVTEANLLILNVKYKDIQVSYRRHTIFVSP